MTDWVAWVEPVDDDGRPLLDPPRWYVLPMFKDRTLTKYRGSAARFTSKEKALAMAEGNARNGAPFGAEQLPERPSSLGS